MSLANSLALSSAVCFALASLVFTHFARKASVMWMNSYKCCMALIAFGIAAWITRSGHIPSHTSIALFFISGLVGLNIGDIFLVYAFKAIGPARTLVIFSFQPIVLGIFAYLLFGQILSIQKVFGILFMIACVFTLAYEKFKHERKWDLRGPVYALIGVILDTVGILLTRTAFETDPGISVLEGNFFRCLGAAIGFLVMSSFVRMNLVKTFKKMTPRDRWVVTGGGLLGTFVSLWLYLTAISIGHLATISAIIGTGPLFAGIFEAIAQRKLPSRYLYYAFILCGFGFYLVL